MILSLKTLASKYASFGIEGTSYLTFRDIPHLIKKCVSGSRALDIGCGAGRSTRFLKSCGLDVVGVDRSEDFLNEAQYRDLESKYYLVTDSRLPFKNNSFDLVFLSHVLVMIPSLNEMEILMNEVHRVLKKNGISIIVTANDEMHLPSNDWVSYDTDFPENYNIISGKPVRLKIKGRDLIFVDYNWFDADYTSIFSKVKLEVIEKIYPKGLDQDGIAWKFEKESAPYIIYVLRKN